MGRRTILRQGERNADGSCGNSTLTSPIVTLVVGRDQRLFAAHEDVLSMSPFFEAALRGQFFESATKQVQLPDESVFLPTPYIVPYMQQQADAHS